MLQKNNPNSNCTNRLQKNFPKTFKLIDNGYLCLAEFIDDLYESCYNEDIDLMKNFISFKASLREAGRISKQEIRSTNSKYWPCSLEVNSVIYDSLINFQEIMEKRLYQIEMEREVYIDMIIGDSYKLIRDKTFFGNKEELEDLLDLGNYKQLGDKLLQYGVSKINVYPGGLDEHLLEMYNYVDHWNKTITYFSDPLLFDDYNHSIIKD